MYGNSFYNPQPSVDRINAQINELQKMKEQMQQPIQTPTNLTQNFQLAPQPNITSIKYANSMEEVQKELVIGDTPYFSKDMSVVWIKNTKGEIRTFELNELIPKDEKDLQIEMLQTQIEELRKEIRRNESSTTNVSKSVEDEKPSNVSTISKSTKKSK